MRCLTLAEALREHGVECIFASRQHLGNLTKFITSKGFASYEFNPPTDTFVVNKGANKLLHADWLGGSWQEDALTLKGILTGNKFDWLIVDHYALDFRWESELRSFVNKIVVLDDLADREHHCDLLLDQNLGHVEEDYVSLVPKCCKILTGPKYALLRPQFNKWRSASLARREYPRFKHILVALGGVDKDNLTADFLRSIGDLALPDNSHITIVIGYNYPYIAELRHIAQGIVYPVDLRIQIDNVAELMSDVDLAIGSAGLGAWERCCLGVPSLVYVLAENQRSGSEALEKIGAAIIIKDTSDIGPIIKKILGQSEKYDILRELSRNSSAVTSGDGLNLIAEKMLNFDDQ
jgi:UDP-2,4-diacetamido-2,4,6-trideoxy-beta-L-altropyranose hydrolase